MDHLEQALKKPFKDPKEHIVDIVKILSKEMEQYPTPSVTMISWQKDSYKVLISCLLSLRTRDHTTIAASERLFKVADTPERMLKLSLEELQKLIYPVGFYKTKAERIQEINKILIDQYKGEVPKEMDILLTLKGVG